MKEKGKQQNGSESVSDTDTSTTILKCYRLDKYYFPGNKFQFTFINKDVDCTKIKKAETNLEKLLKKLEREFATLTGDKKLNMQRGKENYHAYLAVVSLKV